MVIAVDTAQPFASVPDLSPPGEAFFGVFDKLLVRCEFDRVIGIDDPHDTLSMTYEITKQLRGEAGKRQVPDASVGLCQNMGGSGASSVVHILERC